MIYLLLGDCQRCHLDAMKPPLCTFPLPLPALCSTKGVIGWERIEGEGYGSRRFFEDPPIIKVGVYVYL